MNIVPILIQTIVMLVVIYLFFGVYVFVNQKSFIYFPDSADLTACKEFSEFTYTIEHTTRMLYKKGVSGIAIVYYHGNAGSVCDRSYVKDVLEKTPHSIIFVEYAGYANSSKSPSKQAILQNVNDATEFISKQGYTKTIVIGSSLGSGPASYHTTISSVESLILISPFSSIVDVAKKTYWMYPVKQLLTQNYDNIKWLQSFTGDVTIFHGKNDVVIPNVFSQKLFSSLKTKKQYKTYESFGHNDLWNSKDFIEDLKTIIST